MIKVGERLSGERQKRGLTLKEISDATKIREEFLAFIEKSDYKKLPSATYAKGFVGSYAKFLNIPEKEILALFRREFNEDKELKILPEEFTGKKDIHIHGSKIKQAAVLVILVILALFGYIAFQYRFAVISPPLKIVAPIEEAVISASTVTISGKTDPNSTIYIDDQSVSVEQDGSFKKEITVFPGKTIIKVLAVNRFGRQTTLERHIEVK